MQPLANEAAYGFAKMQENWADAATFTRTKLFRDALDSWKQTAIWNRGNNKPIPPAPEVPILVSVNMELAKQRYMESLETGVPIVHDFYIETPLAVAPDAFELDQKVVAPNDPVLSPDGDIEGQFLVATGDTHKDGETFTHPTYGKLKMKFKYTPFGASKRWVKAN